ncbi:MAG TPA: hypothetical protein VIL65_01115 [Beijerinckiaceae bacterium]
MTGLKAPQLYVAALLVTGLVAGVLVAKAPAVNRLPMPVFTIPLVVSFLIDTALLLLSQRGRAEPLPMPYRLAGFIGAVLLAMVVSGLLGGPA